MSKRADVYATHAPARGGRAAADSSAHPFADAVAAASARPSRGPVNDAPAAGAGLCTVTVDGRAVRVRPGTTILAAARAAGVDVPTLCFLEGVSEVGSCRVCVVEVSGRRELVSSCNTPVADGMEVVTDSPRVLASRRAALQLVLARHGLDSTDYCFSCVKNGSCELQDVCRACGVADTPYRERHGRRPVLDDNPFLAFDPNLCIACQRCVGACNNAAFNHALTAGRRGVRTAIAAPFGADWDASGCESCGNCAQACPTGALTVKRRRSYRSWETRKVRTTCPHCAVGCQLDLVVKDGRIVDAQAADGPSNGGLLCVKGRSASFDFVDCADRLRTPLVRNRATGALEPATWDEALDAVAEGFGRIVERQGGGAIAAFACSRSTNEDIYLFQKMARVAFKTNNVDNCARV